MKMLHDVFMGTDSLPQVAVRCPHVAMSLSSIAKPDLVALAQHGVAWADLEAKLN
jgi:hypothetical protein